MKIVNLKNYPFIGYLNFYRIEEIWENKIEKILIYFHNKNNRWVCTISFSDNSIISRNCAAWILEIKIGRKIITSRIGGNETVDHIDNNKLNDHPDNLQMLTNVQNSIKGNKDNPKFGVKNGNHKLTDEEVYDILDLYYNKRINNKIICEKYNIDRIGYIINKKNWKHIEFKIPTNFIKPDDSRSKLSKDDVLEILDLYYKCGKDIKTIYDIFINRNYNVNYPVINKIILRTRWKHIPYKISDEFIKPMYNFYKFNEIQIQEIIYKYYVLHKSLIELSIEYNTKNSNIFYIVNGRSWKQFKYYIDSLRFLFDFKNYYSNNLIYNNNDYNILSDELSSVIIFNEKIEYIRNDNIIYDII